MLRGNTKSSDDGNDESNGKKKKEGGISLAPFLKMRRRLTVTGTSDNIDGHMSKLNVEDSSATSKKKITGRCAVTAYSGVSKKGHAPYNPRKKNQDALIMTNDPNTNSLILCVLDGHGEHGDGVAGKFRDNLAGEIMKHPLWATDIKKATRDAIFKVEHQVIRNFRIDTEFSGTTLSMAVIRGNHITGINIGDSRVVIGKEDASGKIVAEEFTHDHKPDTPLEKERILAAGGRVFAVEYDDGIDGPPRVWLGHMDVPGLAMSRSLGDAVAHTAGVISEPEFTERELDPKDKFIILATDGLWEFVTNEECIDMAVASENLSSSVDILVREANARWMREEQVIDDTTVICGHLFDYRKEK